MAEFNVRDEGAPIELLLQVMGPGAEDWGVIHATAKQFSTGSRGFYASGKVANPKTGKRYQVGCTVTLVGSKPEVSALTVTPEQAKVAAPEAPRKTAAEIRAAAK